MQVNETAPTNASGLFLIAAILCTIKATPLLSGMMDGTISMFFTIAVIVISAMILLRPRDPEYTRIPCVTGIIAGLLDTAVYMIGRFQQHTLLGFISDYNGSKVTVFHNTGSTDVNVDLSLYTDIDFSVIRGYAGRGKAHLNGKTLTLGGYTSVVLK